MCVHTHKFVFTDSDRGTRESTLIYTHMIVHLFSGGKFSRPVVEAKRAGGEAKPRCLQCRLKSMCPMFLFKNEQNGQTG